MTRHINLNNPWELCLTDAERAEFENYVRQNPSAEQLKWYRDECQRDFERAKDEQDWTEWDR